MKFREKKNELLTAQETNYCEITKPIQPYRSWERPWHCMVPGGQGLVQNDRQPHVRLGP